jgi:hypothetical protein
VSTEPAEYVVAHIRDRLASDGDIAELGVGVTVHGERVFLDGSVHSVEHRDAIVAAAREVAAGYEICADIIVCEPADGGPEERLR